MDTKEILDFVDQLVFESTGKYLDDVQRAVIKGTWQGQTYEDIGKKCHRSPHHVRDIGYQLWQLLSKQLGEDINKRNFTSTIERLRLRSSQFINIQDSHNFKFCSYPYQYKDSNLEQNTIIKVAVNDLTIAPKITYFCDRDNEIEKLSDWLFNQNNRLISVLGLSGIGKTTLVKRFIDINSQHFEVIIWKSLKFTKMLDAMIADCLQVCQQDTKDGTEDKLRQLLDILNKKRCLIVLDDVHNLFREGQFSGQYKTEYKDYQNLFKMMTETIHQSHLILISQEQSVEMRCLDEEFYPVKCLELSGIKHSDILNNQGLTDQDSWLKLINLYEGNPSYLKYIALLIKDIFAGKVSEFLDSADNLVIPENIQANFRQIWHRLSDIEQKIFLELSKSEQPVAREALRENLDLSSSDLLKGLQSLQQRYLVQRLNGDKILFNLSPIWREFLNNNYLD
jgi:hypothetical protein